MTKRILVLVINPAVDQILTVKTFTPFTKNQVHSGNKYIGGKGMNAAYVLGRLGADCLAMGFTSAEHQEAFKNRLVTVGVNTQFIPVDGKTRENFKIVDLSIGRDTEFNQPGFHIAESDIEKLFTQIEKKIHHYSWLILNGSLPLGAPVDLYARMIDLAHSLGVKTCLDASGDPMANGVTAKPDILRGNLYELEELCGHSLEDKTQIAGELVRLHQTGIQYVVVSLGSQGVIGFDGVDLLCASAPELSPVSLTGAGDAMTAAFVHQIGEGHPFWDALAFSAAVASASVLREEPGDFSMEDTQNLLKIIRVERLN